MARCSSQARLVVLVACLISIKGTCCWGVEPGMYYPSYAPSAYGYAYGYAYAYPSGGILDDGNFGISMGQAKGIYGYYGYYSPHQYPSGYYAQAPVSAAKAQAETAVTQTASSSVSTNASKSASLSLKSASSSSSTAVTSETAGQCYCPYDIDWSTWALNDPSCRSALQAKCKTDSSRLPCSWVDTYYAARGSTNVTTAPHEKDIVAFLYNDCPPARPCSCSLLTFDQQDAATLVYACCQDLQVYAAIPFSGLAKPAVDAYCGRNGNPKVVQTWVQYALWHENCTGKTDTGVYSYNPSALERNLQVTSDSSSSASNSDDSSGRSKKTAIAAAAAGIGGAALGALVAAATLTWWSKRGTASSYNRLQGGSV